MKTDIGSDRLAAGGDDLYAMLMAAHGDLSFEESAALNARLVLLLMNAVGDRATIEACLEASRAGPASARPSG